MITTKTINAGDVFSDWVKAAGSFLVRVLDDPGANVLRVQIASNPNDANTVQNITDDDGLDEALTEKGTYAFDLPTTDLSVRVGCPSADYSSGAFDVELVTK